MGLVLLRGLENPVPHLARHLQGRRAGYPRHLGPHGDPAGHPDRPALPGRSECADGGVLSPQEWVRPFESGDDRCEARGAQEAACGGYGEVESRSDGEGGGEGSGGGDGR